ncbi:hypothetical protein [Taibaiella chishuiensis]|uniref:Uncharacterized protein n=1 Tax=Taibaiella chishuiensis TaxID=1434707 RepID=A0A2P8DB26_9BACT|nr:hypothetical protein [Taibaiella chishuiensis]PSK94426.1 hypothetical protein B0I18_101582 [Taibaiella chishuiensis]
MDIILLIYLCWRMKKIVKPKGYNANTWQLYVVAAWILAEIAGMVVSFMLGKDLDTMMITGILCAVLSYLVLHQRAKALPDRSGNDDWISKLGNDRDYMS